MPVKAYFHGKGDEVMASMRKKHGARAEEMFHRTANKYGMRPKSNMVGSMRGAWGDVGAKRQAEAAKLGGFKVPTVHTAKEFA